MMRYLYRIVAAITVFMLIVTGTVAGARYYVNSSGGSNSNNGLSWAAAFATVQKALDVSAAGDTVWVAKGRYVPVQDRNGSTASNRSRYRTFKLKNGVQLYGGFAGNELPGDDISLRDFAANETILSGDINGNDGANFANNSENTYNVVAALAGIGSTTVLDGFTISGGNANGSGSPIGYGGGMSVEGGASLTLSHVTFRSNSAGGSTSAGGGGLNLDYGNVNMVNIQFIGNRGGIRSGGGSTLWITNGIFMDNADVTTGGGVRLASITATLTNVTFYNNSTSDRSGGADVLSSATVSIRNCIFYGNSSSSSPDLGGHPTIYNSLVGNVFYDGSGNTAPMGYPLFVDTAARNLRLQAASPVRGMGDTVFFAASQTPDLSAITTDIAGDPRIVGGQIDLGAYQSNYTSCAGVPLPGIITAVADSVCVRDAVTLALAQNSHTLSGISYLWQKRTPSGSGAWTDMPLVTDTLLPVSGQSVTTDYRCLIICGNSSDTSYSNTFTVKSYLCDQRWYVQTSGGNDNNTGRSWTDAFATVQQALDVSWPGDTVWVAKGRYVPSQDRNGSTASNRSRNRTFKLKDSVQLYGGFAGNEPRGYNISLRDFVTNETILSGDINGNDGANFANNSENTYNVVAALAGIGSTTVLDGFTISSGNASGSSSPTGYGGGMSIEGGASPALVNMVFRSNKAGLSGGGGLNVDNSSTDLVNVQFMGNGGGIRAVSGMLRITNAVFADNTGANVGGGVRVNAGSDVTLTNVTFFRNKANNSGGGIDVQSGSGTTATLRNCIVYGNEAPAGPDVNGTATIRNSLVDGDYYDASGNVTPKGYPFFIDSAARNLRLQAGSPVRSAGDPAFFAAGQTPDLSAVTTDIAGDPRIVGGQIDLGAYQSNYTSCAGVPLPGIVTTDEDSVCVRETVTLALSQNSHTLSGISYLWQQRVPSGSGAWTDLPLVTDTLLPVSGQSVTTDYRCLVICSNSLDTSYSNTVTVKSYPCDQRWYVQASGGNNNNTGRSWTDAFATVQQALDVSWPGDTVWVAKGRYVPSQDRNGSTASNRSRYRTFKLRDSVQLYGGFAGNEPPGYDISLRDFAANETILSGDINGNDGANFANNGENTYNVVAALAGIGSTTVLDGFTISGGNANGNGSPIGYGGGLSVEGGAAPTLTYVTFRSNSAGGSTSAGGGGMNLDYGNVNMVNVRFIGNRGGIRTGGGSTLWITNGIFMDNGNITIGGGIRLVSTTGTFTNVTFYKNSTSDRSGGLDVLSSSTASIRNCIIYGNSAPSAPDMNGSATIRNTLIGDKFYDGSGNVSTMGAPLFVNAASGDLRLQPGCPLRNMGDPVFFSTGQTPDLSAVTKDIAGAPRIITGLIDPGAYQTSYPPLDATIVTFVEPEDGDTVCADGNLPVKIAVSNYGNQTLSGMPVTLDYGAGTINTTLAGPLPAGHTDTLLIPGADMSAAGPRRIKAYTSLAGDANAGNDTLQVNVVVHVPKPVSLGNDTAFCAGDTLVLDAGAGSVVAWNTGAATSVLRVAGSGTYAVAVTDSVGCPVYDTIQVTVYPLPAAVITPAGNMAFCQGDSITLHAGAQPGVAYVWQKDGIPVGSDTDYTASVSGQYRVLASDSHSCGDSSAVTVIEVLPQPVVEVTPQEAGFCAGGNVLLEGHSPDTAGLAWQWMDANGLIPGANASFYQVDVPGTYQLTVKRTGAAVICADSSDSVVVTEYPLPAPVIYWDGITLITDSIYITYQWYCDGQLLPFANSYRYTPAQPGGFNVMVTDTNGCDNASAPKHVQPTGAGRLLGYDEAVRIYPNPVSAMLVIESPVAAMIVVSGMDGAAVLRETADRPGKTVLNLSGLADGLYYIRITGQDGMLLRMEKLVKNGH